MNVLEILSIGIHIKDGGGDMTPWEKPRIKRIIELFNGHVTEIKQITVIRSGNNEKEIYR